MVERNVRVGARHSPRYAVGRQRRAGVTRTLAQTDGAYGYDG